MEIAVPGLLVVGDDKTKGCGSLACPPDGIQQIPVGCFRSGGGDGSRGGQPAPGTCGIAKEVSRLKEWTMNAVYPGARGGVGQGCPQSVDSPLNVSRKEIDTEAVVSACSLRKEGETQFRSLRK